MAADLANEAPTPQGQSRWVAEVVLVPCWSSASRAGPGEPVKGSQPCAYGAAPPGWR